MNKAIRTVTMVMAVVLTARLGVVQFEGHRETWYDLNMSKVCQNATENGIEGDYWVTEDGLKMYGPFVIVAADWNIHPYGSLVNTSRGIGIVLDTGTFKDRATVDIATDWK